MPPPAPIYPDRTAESLPLLLKRKCFCKHGVGDAFSPVLLCFSTQTRLFYVPSPQNVRFLKHLLCFQSSYLVLMVASDCPPVLSSIICLRRIAHHLISRLHLSLGEERRTLSTRCRPRRLLLCRLAQSCLATLAAAGCYIRPSLTKRVGVWSGYPEEIGCLQMVCYVTSDGPYDYFFSAAGTFLFFIFTV